MEDKYKAETHQGVYIRSATREKKGFMTTPTNITKER